jgi:hypothetical protein
MQIKLHTPSQLSRYSDGLRAGRPWFYSRQEQAVLRLSMALSPAQRPVQPHIQRLPAAHSERGETEH